MTNKNDTPPRYLYRFVCYERLCDKGPLFPALSGPETGPISVVSYPRAVVNGFHGP